MKKYLNGKFLFGCHPKIVYGKQKLLPYRDSSDERKRESVGEGNESVSEKKGSNRRQRREGEKEVVTGREIDGEREREGDRGRVVGW